MNNVQCGVWHGRGDTICLGSNGEGNKAFAALNKASLVPIKSPGLCGMDRMSNAADEHEPLVPPDQLEQVQVFCMATTSALSQKGLDSAEKRKIIGTSILCRLIQVPASIDPKK